MAENMLHAPFELTDAELDQVGGGLALAAGGLVNLAVSTGNIDVLRNADILNNVSVLDNNNVTLRDIANANHIGVGVLIQALGGVAGILQHV